MLETKHSSCRTCGFNSVLASRSISPPPLLGPSSFLAFDSGQAVGKAKYFSVGQVNTDQVKCKPQPQSMTA